VGVVTGYRASWSDGFIPFCDDGAKFAEVIQGDEGGAMGEVFFMRLRIEMCGWLAWYVKLIPFPTALGADLPSHPAVVRRN
jgi:hypothetical protein